MGIYWGDDLLLAAECGFERSDDLSRVAGVTQVESHHIFGGPIAVLSNDLHARQVKLVKHGVHDLRSGVGYCNDVAFPIGRITKVDFIHGQITFRLVRPYRMSRALSTPCFRAGMR